MQSHEAGLRWLCADESANHHTLSDFRVRYEEALDGLFSQVLAVLEQRAWRTLGRWCWTGRRRVRRAGWRVCIAGRRWRRV